jgi:hypothetical protein
MKTDDKNAYISQDDFDAMIKQVSKDLDNDINKSIMDILLKDVHSTMNIPPNILTSSSYASPSSVINTPWSMPPSVITDYPITNYSWYKIGRDEYSIKDSKLVDTIKGNVGVQNYLNNLYLLHGECFFSRLEDARPKEDKNENDNHPSLSKGHTYDPWFRNITSHRGTYYQKISYAEAGFDSETSFQIKVMPNYEEVLLMWGFSSTINKVPIYLFLYTFADFAYVNVRKKDNHMKSIHPYMASDVADYNLSEPLFAPSPSTQSVTSNFMIGNGGGGVNYLGASSIWSNP